MADYRPPRWPDGEHLKRYHLDFEVSDIEPEGYGWRVCADPVGHPFCLCRHEGITWTDKGVAWP